MCDRSCVSAYTPGRKSAITFCMYNGQSVMPQMNVRLKTKSAELKGPQVVARAAHRSFSVRGDQGPHHLSQTSQNSFSAASFIPKDFDQHYRDSRRRFVVVFFENILDSRSNRIFGQELCQQRRLTLKLYLPESATLDPVHRPYRQRYTPRKSARLFPVCRPCFGEGQMFRTICTMTSQTFSISWRRRSN